MNVDKPELPQRAPYRAHDRELDEANRLGIRPPTDAESDPGRRASRARVIGRRRGKG